MAKDAISFGIGAAAAGAGAMIILLSIIIVASKKVLSSGEFYDRYGLKEVAKFPKSGTGRSGMSDKERYDIAAENINEYSKNSNNILVVGKAPKAAINLAIEELRKRMGNISIDHIESGNFAALVGARAYLRLPSTTCTQRPNTPASSRRLLLTACAVI